MFELLALIVSLGIYRHIPIQITERIDLTSINVRSIRSVIPIGLYVILNHIPFFILPFNTLTVH